MVWKNFSKFINKQKLLNDIINNAAYSMDILTKDIETKNNQSKTGPTLNSSSGILRIINKNEKELQSTQQTVWK